MRKRPPKRRTRRPAYLSTAIDILHATGSDALQQYFDSLSSAERGIIDQWLLGTGHALIRQPGTQLWRFQQLVHELHEQRYGHTK